MKDNTHARQGERRHEGTLRPTRTRLRGGGCHLDAEARLLVVLDNGAHECAVPLEMLEHHLAEHLAVGARPWVGASHEDSETSEAAAHNAERSPQFGETARNTLVDRE